MQARTQPDRANAGWDFLCSIREKQPMANTYDFTIVSVTEVPGVSLVYAHNEDAYNYLTDEVDMTTLSDGSAPISRSRVGDFINDAEYAHLCSEYV
tara:strand:- start:193 stop:480 length:288 start_codon:yes stop_codon:yes gene_type:complete